MKTTKFLLVIDIGNTAISFGVMKNLELVGNDHLDTVFLKNRIQKPLEDILSKIKRKFPKIEKVVICSVVPSLTKTVQSVIKKYLNLQVLVVGQDIIVPIKNKYDNPNQVGQDRLVGAFAAKALYGFPCIIIDFGTAITFDVVSAKGSYEGGIIIPGIRLSAESLFQKTALLPRVETIDAPKTLVGKSTKESILSGLFFGYGAMSAGLIDRISQEIKGKPKVIITGGYTHLMKKFLIGKIDKVDRDLVFKGLALLANR